MTRQGGEPRAAKETTRTINFQTLGGIIMEGELAHIGAGLAAIGTGTAAIGVGHVVGNYLAGALRNPSAAAGQTATLFIGIAFAEALGIFAFLMALLLMYTT